MNDVTRNRLQAAQRAIDHATTDLSQAEALEILEELAEYTETCLKALEEDIAWNEADDDDE